MRSASINDKIVTVKQIRRPLMDWNTVLQDIIDYIENHLQRDEEAINNDEIARIAGCSFNFFQKVFSYMNKISFAEYIRYRKLTLAGYDIKSTNLKVVDISYKYGYDSPTSFTKAFQQFHGVSPKAARSRDVELKVYPKMQMHSKQQYAWRLEQKKGFRLIGKKIKVSRKNNAHYSKVPEFWNECQRNGIFSKLISLDTANNQVIFIQITHHFLINCTRLYGTTIQHTFFSAITNSFMYRI